jgi:hypothetical protein
MMITIDETHFSPGKTSYLIKIGFKDGERAFLFDRDTDSGRITTEAKQLPSALISLIKAQIRDHVALINVD